MNQTAEAAIENASANEPRHATPFEWAETLGIKPRILHRNCSVAMLVERAIRGGEADLSAEGALICTTSPHTRRSPGDKFIVASGGVSDLVQWNEWNQPMSGRHYHRLVDTLRQAFEGAELFLQDMAVGTGVHRLRVRLLTTHARRALLARNLFVELEPSELAAFTPDLTILDAPAAQARPSEHGTRSDTFIVINGGTRTILIGGTSYGGELKKAVFTAANLILPEKGCLPLHCGATADGGGHVVLIFGLSSTASLSLTGSRRILGDTENCWDDGGIGGLERGCFLKSPAFAHEWGAAMATRARQLGSIIENGLMDADSSVVDLEANPDARFCFALPERTAVTGRRAGHPRTILFVTWDSFGVLPALSRIDREQAPFWFLSGYGGLVSPTLGDPARNSFSACYAEPFLPLAAPRYAAMFAERIKHHVCDAWLVNVGMLAARGTSSPAFDLAQMRALVGAVLEDKFRNGSFVSSPVLDLEVPVGCDGIDPSALYPWRTASRSADYERGTLRLAAALRANFRRHPGTSVPDLHDLSPGP
jgi:phosphoenolpyruvate carboxykinase (ATP)